MAIDLATFRVTSALPAHGRSAELARRAARIVGAYLLVGLSFGLLVLSLQFPRLWSAVGILAGLILGRGLIVALIDFAVSSEVLTRIFQPRPSQSHRLHFDTIYRAVLIMYVLAGSVLLESQAKTGTVLGVALGVLPAVLFASAAVRSAGVMSDVFVTLLNEIARLMRVLPRIGERTRRRA